MSKESEDTQTATDADIEPEVPETSETAASSEADVQVSDQTPTSEGRWLPMLLAGLAMLATAGVGWFGWTEFARLEQQIQSLAQQVESVSGIQTQLAATDNRLQGLTDELSRLGGEIQRSDARNQAVIDRVESVADALARAQVDTRTSYTLAEAEYLLKIADQRLLVERNPETAQTLMRTAQQLLGQLEDGRLLPVREALAADIQALDRVEMVDVLGVQAQLLALDSALDDLTLPVRRLMEPVEDTGVASEALADQWLARLQEYIRIREVDAPIAPLVTASDAGRAREILRLNLEQIKVALIREDQRLFDAGITQALRLIAHYFSVQDPAGASVLDALQGLQGTPVVQVIPDAASGLRALKRYREARLADRALTSEVSE